MNEFTHTTIVFPAELNLWDLIDDVVRPACEHCAAEVVSMKFLGTGGWEVIFHDPNGEIYHLEQWMEGYRFAKRVPVIRKNH